MNVLQTLVSMVDSAFRHLMPVIFVVVLQAILVSTAQMVTFPPSCLCKFIHLFNHWAATTVTFDLFGEMSVFVI